MTDAPPEVLELQLRLWNLTTYLMQTKWDQVDFNQLRASLEEAEAMRAQIQGRTL